MNTKIKAGLAALLAVGTVAASAAPANADRYWGGHEGRWGGHERYEHGYYGGRGYGGGALLGAGIAGLAVGAALASPRYGYGHGYGYGYRPRYYDYGPGYYDYGTCLVRRSVWDPYYGGYIVRRVPVPC